MEDTNNLSVILVFLLIVVGYLFIFYYQKVRKTYLKQEQQQQQPGKEYQNDKPELPPLPFIELTEKQLAEYDGTRTDGRILIAFKGNIYDVSTGLGEFGAKGALGCVAGKNFTEYLDRTLQPTETKMSFIERWEILLDKNYERVGVLIDDNDNDDDDDGNKANESDDNQEKAMQEKIKSFNLSEESSIETITNDSVMEVGPINETTITLMKDFMPEEMLENEQPPQILTEELS